MKNLYKVFIRGSIFILMMTWISSLYAQNAVSGTVTDENGNPLPGVSILVKGTTNGTSSDNDGKYTLSVPSDAMLVVSFIGYKSQEVAVGSRSNICSVISTAAVSRNSDCCICVC